MPKADFEELLMVYTRLYKISQVYKVNHRRRQQPSPRDAAGEDDEDGAEELLSKEKQRKFYL